MSSAPDWERSTSPARIICCGRFSPASARFSCCTMSARTATPSSSPTGISRSRPNSCARCCRTCGRRRSTSSPMDEVHRRLAERDFARRFACFTLDDGYRDNRDFALPVLREFDAPFTVYVASDFAEGVGRLWWIALEKVIAKAAAIEVTIGGNAVRLDTATPAAKQAAFDRLHDWLRGLPGDRRHQARDRRALCAPRRRRERDLPRPLHVLGGIEVVRRRSADHDRRAFHYPLQSRQADRGGRTPGDRGQPRADRGKPAAAGDRISPIPMATGSPPAPREFALAQAAGFRTAVTTRPGMIFRRERRASDRAAAGLAQRQLPGRAHPAGADLRRRHRDVERLSPHRRGVAHLGFRRAIAAEIASALIP